MWNKETLKSIFSKSRITAIVAVYAIVLTLLGSTFAWVTSLDVNVNHLEGETRLETQISEKFKAPTDWQPGMDIKKEVRVFNSGTASAFVRLSMQEVLKLYAIDIDGISGAEGTAKAVGTTPVQTVSYSATAYTFGSVDNATRAAIRGGTIDAAFGFITLKFNQNVYVAGDAGIPTDGTPYWLYEDGYFYYSEILRANQFTEPLLEKVGLSGNMPNSLKVADYQISVSHTNCVANEIGLGTWSLNASSAAQQMLEEHFS